MQTMKIKKIAIYGMAVLMLVGIVSALSKMYLGERDRRAVAELASEQNKAALLHYSDAVNEQIMYYRDSVERLNIDYTTARDKMEIMSRELETANLENAASKDSDGLERTINSRTVELWADIESATRDY